MVSLKSVIKRNFKPQYFPENVCTLSIIKKLNGLLVGLVDHDEEVIVTIDNEFASDTVDCVVFTIRNILILRGNSAQKVSYDEIQGLKLPAKKIKDPKEQILDYKMNRSDKAILQLKSGEDINIRIIYGGIYLLDTFLNHHILSSS